MHMGLPPGPHLEQVFLESAVSALRFPTFMSSCGLGGM